MQTLNFDFPLIRAALSDIFEVIDLDGNGLLSFEEYNFFELRTSGEKCDSEAWAMCRGEVNSFICRLIIPVYSVLNKSHFICACFSLVVCLYTESQYFLMEKAL